MDREAERGCIERARAGSLEAFDRLMLAWEQRLYRFLRQRGLAPADAEDVLQETFLQAWRHLGSYRARFRFSTWLYTIAIREAGRRRRPAAGEKPSALEPAGDAGMPVTPAERCHEDQLRENLWHLARTVLSEAQFTALWLFYVEEFDVAEISAALHRSRSWVKVNLHRARRRLEAALGDPADQHAGRRMDHATIEP